MIPSHSFCLLLLYTKRHFLHSSVILTSEKIFVWAKCSRRHGLPHQSPMTSTMPLWTACQSGHSSRRRGQYPSLKPACDESTDLLQIGTVEMEEKLCRFIMEARQQDRETYPSKTVYRIVASIQRYLCGNGHHEISFLIVSDPTFAHLQQTLHANMLTAAGVGTSSNWCSYRCYSFVLFWSAVIPFLSLGDAFSANFHFDLGMEHSSRF